MKTPFEILDCDESASDSEIKSAYLKKVRQFSPDRYPEKFKEIKDAYDAVRSSKKRIAHRLFDVIEPDLSTLFISALKTEKKRMKGEDFLKILVGVAKDEVKHNPLKRS